MIRNTRYQGHDFEVFWRAGKDFLNGDSIYSLQGRGAMVFKYPPWMAPFFSPFSLLTLEWAKWFFGAIQVGSLFLITRILKKKVHHPEMIAVSLLMFWGLWVVHALDGQINLTLLAIVLFFGTGSPSRVVASSIALSTKIFSLFPIVSELVFSSKRKNQLLGVLTATILCVGFSYFTYGRVWNLDSWHAAVVSGGTQFDGDKIRGRDNQGLPALVLRSFQIPSDYSRYDLPLSFSFFFLGIILIWFVNSRSQDERVALALAWIPVAHPLAWFHLFVFCFPAATLFLDRAWAVRRDSKLPLYVTLFSIVLIALVTRNTFGVFGEKLELISIKSLGVLGLFLAARQLNTRLFFKKLNHIP